VLYWALIFLIVAIVGGALGFSGASGMAVNIAWISFVVGLVLAIVLLFARRRPVP
jgi:uncharacterized membrane protein YtjA (UPF0391 family)